MSWNNNIEACPLNTRVCLLSAGNSFLFPQQEFIGTLTFNGKFITRGECYNGNPDYFYRSKIIAWKFENERSDYENKSVRLQLAKKVK